MTKKQLEKTTWAKKFKVDDPSDYDQAIFYALKNPLCVDIQRTDENGEMLWAIQVVDSSFWMEAFPLKTQAINLCNKMGWDIQELGI